MGERHAGQSRGVVPHGEAAAKEWTSPKAQRVEGRKSNGCLVELLNKSELELTCCVLALEGQWSGAARVFVVFLLFYC